MRVTPRFFDGFKCTAGDCPDTCCAGWEIDVDADTLEYYRSLPMQDREFIEKRLVCRSEEEVLLCCEGKRCEFLNENNLCELILRYGEDALCDICREHPRFYSETENISEVGVGLCCYEAARLWICEPCVFVCVDDGYPVNEAEKELYDRQMRMIERVTCGSGSLGERLFELIGDDCVNVELYADLCKLYGGIELMDKEFPKRFSPAVPHASDVAYKNLAAYFIYRYYFELGEELCARFTAASLIIIAAMGEDIAVSAKDYSKEVEYDTDNLDAIYAFLVNCSGLGVLARETFDGVM